MVLEEEPHAGNGTAHGSGDGDHEHHTLSHFSVSVWPFNETSADYLSFDTLSCLKAYTDVDGVEGEGGE